MDERNLSFFEIDKKYKNQLKRPCIDGISRNKSLCTAYCTYDEHPGFLTDKLIKKHCCEERNCDLIRKKVNLKHRRSTIEIDTSSDGFIENILKKYEGMKIMESHRITQNFWHVKYIAIAKYDTDKIRQDILDKFDVEIEFENLNYSFENAAKIIFK